MNGVIFFFGSGWVARAIPSMEQTPQTYKTYGVWKKMRILVFLVGRVYIVVDHHQNILPFVTGL